MKFVFDRYIAWRLPELTAPQHVAMLEYPLQLRPRYGWGRPPHGRLYEIINSGRDRYTARLRDIVARKDDLARIAAESPPNTDTYGDKPTFFNAYFSGLDAAALYTFLVDLNPKRYFEVGSGNSTKFARCAIRDHKLQTAITSFDPAPRAEVDAICDRVVRQGVEDVDLAEFDDLGPGDILFVDNSHYVFMNSDVTAIFLDVLPRLKPGVIVHFHDIFLPYDYPPQWQKRHFNEQYMLAVTLLSAPEKYEALLPNGFIHLDEELRQEALALWNTAELRVVLDHAEKIMHGLQGYSFWLAVR